MSAREPDAAADGAPGGLDLLPPLAQGITLPGQKGSRAQRALDGRVGLRVDLDRDVFGVGFPQTRGEVRVDLRQDGLELRPVVIIEVALALTAVGEVSFLPPALELGVFVGIRIVRRVNIVVDCLVTIRSHFFA